MSSRSSKRRSPSSSDGGKSSKKSKPNDENKEPSCFYAWDDKGTLQSDGSVDHNRLEVTIGKKTFLVMVGDAVLMKSDDTVVNGEGRLSHDGDIAQVDRMWEEIPKKRTKPARMMMRARWYFKKSDVESLTGDISGSISREDLLKTMTDKNLVLSNQTDNNIIETIVGRCLVITRKPTTPPEGLPSTPLPENVFLSNYRINFGKDAAATLSAFDGDNEEWPIFEPEDLIEESNSSSSSELAPSRRSNRISARSPTNGGGPEANRSRASSIANGPSSSSSSDSESTMDGSTEFSQEDMGPETEGSNLHANISIGPEFQVRVPPFIPGRTVTSRNPVPLWKPNSIPQEMLDSFLVDAAKILKTFMQENDLIVADPYAPLPSARIETMFRQGEIDGEPLTLSRVCTASSMSTTPNQLMRECNLDALLKTLNDHNYNPKEALLAVEASPREYLTIWTRKEKDMFNHTFRRYSGSLRMISKNLSPSKTFKDIVDYHYRFKIPDQFRRYQEKKREQAVRMMECVEKRRALETPVAPRDFGAPESQKPGSSTKNGSDDWHKTGVSNVTRAVEERRAKAKDLFLQVQTEVGTQAMAELAIAVKSLKEGSIEELKDTFVEQLQEHPDLLERFLAFLPKRYRVGVTSKDMVVF